MALIGGWTMAWCGSGLPEWLAGIIGTQKTPLRPETGPFGPESLSQTTWEWYLNFALGVPLPAKGALAWVTGLQRDMFDRGLRTEATGGVFLIALGAALVICALFGATVGALVRVAGRPHFSYHLLERPVRESMSEGLVAATCAAVFAAHVAVLGRAALAICVGDGTTWGRLATAPMVYLGLGTALTAGLLLGLVSGRGWYEHGVASEGGCAACGYPLGDRPLCTECGARARRARGSGRFIVAAMGICAATALTALVAVGLADPLRLARANFRKAYGHKALVVLVPGEATDVRIRGRWLTLQAVNAPGAETPNLLVASQGADTTGTLVVPGPEGIDLAGVQAIWMWDGPVGGAWKGLALVLIFDRRDLEAVRRAQVSGAWH